MSHHRTKRQLEFQLFGQMPSGKNQVKITRTGHRYPDKRFVAWRKDALLQLQKPCEQYRQEGVYLPLGSTISLKCIYTPGDRRVRDVPGILDALCHLLMQANIVEDDGLIRNVEWIERVMDRKHPALQFSLTEAP